MKLKWIATLEELSLVAKKIVQQHNCILLFNGELGSGKTTLIKSICKELGSTDQITSPTFGIVHEYVAGKKIFHFDLFRMDSIEALEEIGFEEYLSQDAWIFIEWPEVASPILQKYVCAKIEIQVADIQKRMITLEA